MAYFNISVKVIIFSGSETHCLLMQDKGVKQLDHKLLKAYWERWQAVEAIERRENKATSIAQRWQEMNAIIRLATGLGLSSDENQDQERIVWQHWSRLKSSR